MPQPPSRAEVRRCLRPLLCSLSLMAIAATAGCAVSPQGPANADGEIVPADEAAATAFVVDKIRSTVQSDFDHAGHAFRDAHHKAHGCVQAQFTVLPNLPAKVAQGLFAQARNYDAVVRFSNGSGQSQDDHQRDARGMALKVLGVPGRKILSDELDAHTQDFVMTNHPVFFIRNAHDYIDFMASMTGGNVSKVSWLVRNAFHETPIVLAFTGHQISNPLNSQYWSTTPSKLGTEQMKFSAKPCADSSFLGASDTANYLGDNLQTHLKSQAACFDFMVQTRTVPERMPIEDPTVAWSEADAPLIPVAKIQIKQQAVDNSEACEISSFTPWHSLPEHRPLGGISRVRKEVYLEVSQLRHALNKQPRLEP